MNVHGPGMYFIKFLKFKIIKIDYYLLHSLPNIVSCRLMQQSNQCIYCALIQ
jgi:hypothetical protein